MIEFSGSTWVLPPCFSSTFLYQHFAALDNHTIVEADR